MNQLWLKTIIVDPVSQSVLHRGPEQPLPPGLQADQLTSYLEQRFGPQLSDHQPGQVWLEFENPKPGPEQLGSRILVIPLIVDPQSRDLVPVFPKVREFERLAAALGAERGPVESTAAPRVWIGPLFHHASLLQGINDLAARAIRAGLVAAGLKGGVDRVVAANVDDAIPTAPFLHAMRELDDAVDTCVDAAERAIAVHNSALRLTNDVAKRPDPQNIVRLHDVERHFSSHYSEALTVAERSERLAREIAQIAFGISACTAGLQAELLDRAGVAVLYPPRSYGPSVPLRVDGVRLRATSRLELPVELAGVICRILVDRETRVRLRLKNRPDEGIHLEIETGDILLVTARTQVKAIRRRFLESDGWRERENGVFARRWISPVSAIQPARVVSKVLFGLFALASVDALEVSVDPSGCRAEGADWDRLSGPST